MWLLALLTVSMWPSVGSGAGMEEQQPHLSFFVLQGCTLGIWWLQGPHCLTSSGPHLACSWKGTAGRCSFLVSLRAWVCICRPSESCLPVLIFSSSLVLCCLPMTYGSSGEQGQGGSRREVAHL